MSNLKKVIQLAAQQHGLFAAYQLGEMKIARGSIHTLVNNSMFARIDRGVYLLSGAADTWHRSALQNVFKAGQQALLSHESALINLKLLNEDFVSLRNGEKIPFHVTLPRESNRRVCASVHRSIYKEDLLTRIYVNAIPQVAAEYAIIESVRHMPEKIYSSVIDSAIRRRITDAKKLEEVLGTLWPAPGRSKSRVENIIRGYLQSSKEFALAESIIEARVLRIVSMLTRRRICPQYNVYVNGNRYRIDIAIPELKIAIEVDGFLYHSGRESFDSDKRRQNDLVTAGWTVLRFTAIQSDDEIRRQILRILCDGRVKHA